MAEPQAGKKKRRIPKGRHLSAFKRQRQNEKRAAENLWGHSRLRSIRKKIQKAVAERKKEIAEKTLREAMSLYSKAASRGLVHPRHASRQISKLSSLVLSI